MFFVFRDSYVIYIWVMNIICLFHIFLYGYVTYIHYIFKYKYICKHNTNTNAGGNRRTFFCSGTNGFIDFWVRFFDMRRETILKRLLQSYYANNTPNVRSISWCFRSQFIFASRDPQNLTTAVTVENSTIWQRTPFSVPIVEAQSLPAWSNINFSTAWLDFNFSTPWSDPTS